MNCPRQTFYRYILGWVNERPNKDLIFGSAWHLAMETILRKGIRPESIIEAYQIALDYYRNRGFDEETDLGRFPKIPGVIPEALARYTSRWSLDKFEVLYTEIGGTVPISIEPLRLMHFKIDAIVRNLTTDKISAFEHKTGTKHSRAWEQEKKMSVQTGTYNHVLYCLFKPEDVWGVIVNGTFFRATKSGVVWDENSFVRVPCRKEPDLMQAWLVNTNDWYMSYEDDIYQLDRATPDQEALHCFRMNTEACSKYYGCAYLDFCLSWPNPLRRCEYPPQGFKVEFWDPSRIDTVKTYYDISNGEMRTREVHDAPGHQD
jgi:hypothetical protein